MSDNWLNEERLWAAAHESELGLDRESRQIELQRREAFLLELETDPVRFMSAQLNELKPYAFPKHWRIFYPRVKIEFADSLYANAETIKQNDLRGTHVVRINRGLTWLMFDAIQIFMSRMGVFSYNGQMVVEPFLSEEAARRVLKEIVVNYLLSKKYKRPTELERAWNERCEAEKDVPFRRWLDWPFYLTQMMRFVLAHEIAHVIHKDSTSGPQSIIDREQRADATGIRILLNYTRAMSKRWELQRYGQTIATEGEFRSATLSSLTVLFAFLDITTRAADEMYTQGVLKEKWQKDYPPERRRYRALTRYCVEQGLVLEGNFGVSTDVPSPDRASQILYGLATDIFWCDLDVGIAASLSDGGKPLISFAEAVLAIQEQKRDDAPQVQRRRLDIVRVQLEQAFKQHEDPALLPILLQVIAKLDELCTQNEVLDAPEDSRVYQGLHWIYLPRWRHAGAVPDSAFEEAIWERFVATMKAMGANPMSPQEEKERHEFIWKMERQRDMIRTLSSDAFGFF